MKCIHGAKGDCKTCERSEKTRIQKFCKVHKSIWGNGSWWCLWILWKDKLSERCEEEYLKI